MQKFCAFCAKIFGEKILFKVDHFEPISFNTKSAHKWESNLTHFVGIIHLNKFQQFRWLADKDEQYLYKNYINPYCRCFAFDDALLLTIFKKLVSGRLILL